MSDWRAEYAEALRPEIEKTCQLFLPELEITVSFHQGWEKETEYGELLAQNFERDKSHWLYGFRSTKSRFSL